MIGKLLGIDHGLARIGLAVSDATGLVARELAIIHRKSKREDFAQISRVIEQEQVVGIVVGLPNNLDAVPGQYQQADKVRNWVEHLHAITPLPIIFWDEQLTSEEARELAHQKRRKPAEPIDDLAARIILQSYLDAVRHRLAELPPELGNSGLRAE